MLWVLATYSLISLAVLAVLARMILKIGTLLGTCPERGGVVRAAAVSVATGYSAIGAGGVMLIAGALPLLGHEAALALMAALGLAAICLGLGFTHAVTILRAVAQSGKPEVA